MVPHDATVVIGGTAAVELNSTESGENVSSGTLLTECDTVESDRSNAECGDMVPGLTRVDNDGTVEVSGQAPVSKRNKAEAECRDCVGRVPRQVSLYECDVAEADTSLEMFGGKGDKMPSQASVFISDQARAITDGSAAAVLNKIKIVGNVSAEAHDDEPDMSVAKCVECGYMVQGQLSVSVSDTSLEKCGEKEEKMPGQSRLFTSDQARGIIDDRAAVNMNMIEKGGNVSAEALFTECDTAEFDTRVAEEGKILPGHVRVVIDDKCDTAEPETSVAECRECRDMVRGQMTEVEGDMSNRASATVCKTARLEPIVTKCKERVASLTRDDGLAELNKKMTEYGATVPGQGQATEVKITSLMRRLKDPFLINETTLAAAEASFRRGRNVTFYAL